MTSQSKHMRMAARCCLTVGLAILACERLDIGGDVERLDIDELADLVRVDPGEEVGDAR